MISRRTQTVYVALLNEGTRVCRPVQAKRLRDDVFELLSEATHDPSVEEWQFPPGSVVRCCYEKWSDGVVLIARELVSP